MFNFIARWRAERKLKECLANVASSRKIIDFTVALKAWYKLKGSSIDSKDIYGIRVWVGFKNCRDLIRAIEILESNITNDARNDLNTRPGSLLMDDWFVDEESYRVPTSEVFEKSIIALDAVSNRLPTLNSSTLRMHNINAEVITVTLQNIVEICSRR